MRGHKHSNNHLAQTQVFLNIVLDEAVEEKAGGEKVRIGMVVCRPSTAISTFDFRTLGKGKKRELG